MEELGLHLKPVFQPAEVAYITGSYYASSLSECKHRMVVLYFIFHIYSFQLGSDEPRPPTENAVTACLRNFSGLVLCL